MTGTVKTKPPKNNAEWARNVEKRQKAAENSTSVRAGNWVFSTDDATGNLIAGNVNGGSVVLAEEPEASDNPDVVRRQGQSFIKLERRTNQQAARGSTALVQWDSLAYQTDEWGFVPTGTDIVIPEDGVYTIKYHLAFQANSTAVNKAVLLIDAVVKMAQEYYPANGWYCSMYMIEDFPLNAGQLISAGAYVSGSGTFDFGVSGADTSVYSSLSILKLGVG